MDAHTKRSSTRLDSHLELAKQNGSASRAGNPTEGEGQGVGEKRPKILATRLKRATPLALCNNHNQILYNLCVRFFG